MTSRYEEPINRKNRVAIAQEIEEIEKRRDAPTGKTCIVCQKPINRNESRQTHGKGWAHGRCVKGSK